MWHLHRCLHQWHIASIGCIYRDMYSELICLPRNDSLRHTN